MVNRVFITPDEVRGYGNIISEKSTDDFSLYQSSLVLADNVYTLSYNAGVTVSLSVASVSVTYGASVELSATVLNAGTPVASGETVTFYDGSTSIGTNTTNSSGVATLTKSDFTVGSHQLKAVYGTVNSNTVSLTVNKITSTISLSATSSTITAGSNAELSGTLSVGSGKTITIKQNGTSIVTVTTISGGVFTKTITGLAVGSYSFTAEYAGDDTHTSVTSTEVSVTVSAPEPATLNLVSNKDILSYADSENASLTATVLDASSNPLSGETVTMGAYLVSDDSLVSTIPVTDNGDGTYSGTYASGGVGDIYIKAECNLVSKTYDVEDCEKYLPTSTHTKNANQNRMDTLFDLSTLHNVELSAKVKSTAINGFGLILTTRTGNVSTNADWGDYIWLLNGGSGKFTMQDYNSGIAVSTMSPSPNTDYNLKIEYNNGVFKAYVDNTLIGTLNITLPSSATKCNVGLWNDNKTVTITDFKVKPL